MIGTHWGILEPSAGIIIVSNIGGTLFLAYMSDSASLSEWLTFFITHSLHSNPTLLWNMASCICGTGYTLERQVIVIDIVWGIWERSFIYMELHQLKPT